MPRRLLALDLDGTLLGHDGNLDPRDAAAVRRALASGVAVTLATGRLATGALPSARALGLEVPMVCVDGGVLACSRTARVFAQTALALTSAEVALATMASYALSPFVFLAGAIHGEVAFAENRVLLHGWTREIVLHASLEGQSWRGEPIALAFGVGAESPVRLAAAVIERQLGAGAEVAAFSLTDAHWGVRVKPRGCDKALLLARVAATLGVRRQDVCAVGDWYNDVAMLAWAGRGFTMVDAPDDVRNAASDVLRSRRGEGGAVAEAIERWLG